MRLPWPERAKGLPTVSVPVYNDRSPMNRHLTLVIFAAVAIACHGPGAHAPVGRGQSAGPVPAANPVQSEMRLLTRALEAAVRGVGAGDVRAAEHELHHVHAAKEATEAALREGRYRPPKNPDRLDHFRERDEAFHRDLEGLAEASHRNDVSAAAEALGVVMRGCQGCHAEFR
jgi:hypothetical protein